MNASIPAERQADLDEMARRVIDANLYMTLGTRDPDGSPRLSPVFYTAARYTDFYWLSSPRAQHSRNLAERPQVQIVIFDSAADVGRGEAVYVTAAARQVDAHELDAVCPEAFRAVAGARRFQPAELRGDAAVRLYVAQASSWEAHVPGRHPVHGRGVDTRQPADPTTASAELAAGHPGRAGDGGAATGKAAPGETEPARPRTGSRAARRPAT